MPFEDNLGVSRQVASEERARLRELGAELKLPGYGLILRTAAASHSMRTGSGPDELLELWEDILEQSRHRSAPARYP